MRSRIIKLSSWVLFAFLVACTGLNSDRYLANKRTYMLTQGNPPAYVTGYLDGCSSGRRMAGDKGFPYRRDNSLFETDALYARGWEEGQINCRNEVLQEVLNTNSTQYKNRVPLGLEPPPALIDPQKRANDLETQRMWEEMKK